ncbi:zinc-dependent metalloprotease [Kytococcus schroeteri]|uniref:zinc-dependent metalloprotease n=1 Tax=Kytococcus schroeteri TaxID=138300 RepID=UPI0035EAF5AF
MSQDNLPQDDAGADDEHTPGEGGSEQPTDPMKDMLRQFLGDAVDSPEVDEMLSALGMGGAGAGAAGAGGAATNPMAAMMANNPAAFGALQAQVQQMFAGGDGPVNQQLATDVARRAAAQGGDSSVGEAAQRDAEQVGNVASLWLDAATEFPAASGAVQVVSRAEWVETTMPAWVEALTPLAEGVNSAVASSLTDRLGDDPETLRSQLPPGMSLPGGMDMEAVMGQMAPMMERMSSSMFSLQLGQAAGALSQEVVSGTDVGLPLVPEGRVLVLPTNVRAFAEGLEIDPAEVMLFLTVRESARQRLYAGAPWVRSQVLEAVRSYAADMRLDTDGIEAKLGSVDPTDPEAMQSALSGGLFHPEPSERQKAALTRLETWLALVEGWVDVVTDRATRGTLPHADALAEVVRRRRATQGPAEKTFAGLVGLELRPRRLRDAANLFAAMEDKHGAAARDAVWDHPDIAPDAAALDDVLGYVERWGTNEPGEATGTDFDAELAKLLQDEGGDGGAGAR